MVEKRRIIFACVENAGRSQIAEGFLRKHAPHIEVESAGTNPATELNPIVVEAMNEIGIDITKQKPKKLTARLIQKSLIVNMDCIDAESCPALFVRDAVLWNIPDPKHLDLHQIRKIRDQIENEVLKLIKNLEA